MRIGIVLLIVIWVVWASISTGGLYELKQLNPDYVQSNRSIAYLVSKWNYSQANGHWDRYHVEQCSYYMPNWVKAEACVKARIACEYKSPREKDEFGEKANIFSKEFKSCISEEHPFFGPNEWLNASRALWRVVIVAGVVWIGGGFNKDNKDEKAVRWEKNNKWWAEPLLAWGEEGD